ncbi:MAG: hypothetical protein AVDCRST_MAG79-2808, partial [uncultured Thermoleophilia bacterium]
ERALRGHRRARLHRLLGRPTADRRGRVRRGPRPWGLRPPTTAGPRRRR